MFTKEQARETLDRHLIELDVTLQDLSQYARLGFPSDRHRIIYALAQDLGLTQPFPL